MPKISVVIPVYGVEKYIDQLFASIRQQKFQDFEVIFVDDGSPDRCPELLDEFVRTDSRFKVIHQKNGGVSVARNTGLGIATGEYVYIVDSDDWLADDALDSLWNEAEKTNADLIYGDYYKEIEGNSQYYSVFDRPFHTSDKATIKTLQCAVNVGGRKTKLSSPDFECINHFGGAPWRFMIRRSLLEDNHVRFDPYVRGLGDDILFSLYIYEYVNSVSYASKPIYHYRIVNMSYSHGFKKNLLENYELIFDRMENFLNTCQKDKPHWDFYYARVCYYLQESFKRYFKNHNNPLSEQDRYGEFLSTVSSEPYKTAIKRVPLSLFSGKKQKIKVLLLKFGLYRIYWKLKK